MALRIMDITLSETTSRYLLHQFRTWGAFTQREPFTEQQVQIMLDHDQYYVYRELNNITRSVDFFLGRNGNDKIYRLVPDDKGSIGTVKLKED